jgi:hypothetical protein
VSALAPILVLVGADLGSACVAPAPVLEIREVGAPKNAELDRWIEQAREARSKGRELAFRLQTRAAEAKLEEALASFLRGESLSEYVATLIDLGALYVDAKMEAPARAAFRRAEILESGDRPSERQYPPAVVQRFDVVRAELSRQARVSVAIVGQPEGAEIRWDGRRAGVLPVSIADVLPGEHWLSAWYPGKKPYSALVAVTGEKNRVEVFMTDVEGEPTIDQRALGSAEHAGEPSELEAHALESLLEGRKTLVLIARDRGDSAGPCRAVYRVHRLHGTTPVETMPKGAPFDVARIAGEPVEAPLPAAVEIAPKVEAVHPLLAVAPFGVGQLAEDRTLAGSLFLASESALLATNIIAYAIGRSDRRADGTYGDVPRAQALEVVTDLALGLFVAEVVLGAIDGFVHRGEN